METLETYLYKNHTDKTAETYLYYIDAFILHHPTAKDFLYSDIIRFIEQEKKQEVSSSKLHTKFAAIKRYYYYLLETGERNDHPCKNIQLKKKKHNIQLQDLFTSTELELLMNRENRYQNLELRNKVILSLLINQGLIASEICRLNTEDVNLDMGTIYIKGSKKGAARLLNLKPNQILLIQNYMETSRKQLLKSISKNLIITQRGVTETVDGIHSMIEPLKALYPDRNLNPATIRQSVISNMLNEKKIPLEDVQLFAGHRWPSSTEKYRRKDINEQRILINRWHPLR